MIRARGGFTLIELLVVIVIIAMLAALVLPVVHWALCNGREASAEAMLSQLTQACQVYKTHYNVYPAGDGTKSTIPLVKALATPSSRNQTYFNFQDDMVKGTFPTNAEIRNPVYWDSETIKYYRSVNLKDPNAHNKNSVDLWGKDCKGDDDGVNNWGGD